MITETILQNLGVPRPCFMFGDILTEPINKEVYANELTDKIMAKLDRQMIFDTVRKEIDKCHLSRGDVISMKYNFQVDTTMKVI